MINFVKGMKNKVLVLITIVFCVMLGFLIKDTIQFNKENTEVPETALVDTIVVVPDSIG